MSALGQKPTCAVHKLMSAKRQTRIFQRNLAGAEKGEQQHWLRGLNIKLLSERPP